MLIEKNKTIHQIIWLLGESPMTVTQLKNKTGLAFGTLSYHLKYLRDNGIVNIDKEKKIKGQPTTYSLKKFKEVMNNEIDKAMVRILVTIEDLNTQYNLGNIPKQKYENFKKEIIKELN